MKIFRHLIFSIYTDILILQPLVFPNNVGLNVLVYIAHQLLKKKLNSHIEWGKEDEVLIQEEPATKKLTYMYKKLQPGAWRWFSPFIRN